MRWRTVLILGSACVASAPACARAGDPPPPTVRLEYSHDERCPDEQAFKDAMAAHVQRDLFEPSAAARLVVQFEVRDGLYEGAAALSETPGSIAWLIKRGPLPRDCSAVMDSLALSLAIKLEPMGYRRRSSPAPAASLGLPALPPRPPAAPLVEPVKPVPPSAPPVEPKLPPPSRPRPSFYVELGGGVTVGAVPGIAGIVTLDVGIRLPERPFSFGAQLRWVPRSAIDVYRDQLTISRYTGALLGCTHFLRYLAGCVVGEAGALLASNPPGKHPSPLDAALGGRASVEYPVSPPFSLRASVDGLIRLTSSAVVTRQGPGWTAPGASATLTGGPVFTF